MQPTNPNAFSLDPLDRAGNERRDPEWVKAQQEREDARLLLLSRGNPLTKRVGPETSLVWLPLSVLDSAEGDPGLILLGLEKGAPRFAADIRDHTAPFTVDGATFSSLRDSGWTLSPTELAIAGQATWLTGWHAKHRYCARDGGETVMAEGGFKRINPVSGAQHFPRTDPVAIMLPLHQGDVCLGRSPRFPEGMYSAFAGYLEPCETLESCVIRELKEEAGLTVTSTHYRFSQPWPFSSSLMVGYFANVAAKTLTLDPEEIADARWFNREEILALLDNNGEPGVFVPPPFTIAHQLLRDWAER
ncbi:MutT/nudix family protein [Parvularcula bermudensis HTCC2503]|uniref:NAD(+) diphosphatase n=1 Tax=Parvularcula bermudensis (strain ATCC BAA-594 / HTCC2503 / KCTC 12087) TaxID=314260 RepID=E0TE38_PARBH|nr:NAD(+) diphosphatase [Parvularcula bermudensis]ADM08859.1 MutT/nudix family protein [Parvularcula bermudensis HTCC2503]